MEEESLLLKNSDTKETGRMVKSLKALLKQNSSNLGENFSQYTHQKAPFSSRKVEYNTMEALLKGNSRMNKHAMIAMNIITMEDLKKA